MISGGPAGGVATLRTPFPADVTVLAAAVPARVLDVDAAILSPEERQRLATLGSGRDAAAFARGRSILRRALAARMRVDARDVPLVATPGRPPLPGGSAWGCSIAHTRRLVLVAVAAGSRVGVDAEWVDPSLSAGEMAWIESRMLGVWPSGGGQGRDATRRRFLRAWTRTEAVSKALGTGLDGATDAAAAIALAADPRAGGEPSTPMAPGWTVTDLGLGRDHVGALAVAGIAPDERHGA